VGCPGISSDGLPTWLHVTTHRNDDNASPVSIPALIGTAWSSHQPLDGFSRLTGRRSERCSHVERKRSRRRKGFKDRDVTRIAQVTGMAAGAGEDAIVSGRPR
jgi:hypothetical protein